MNNGNNISDIIFQIADETFEKLKHLNIPPYPKYYHDTFVETLQKIVILRFWTLPKSIVISSPMRGKKRWSVRRVLDL